MSKKTKATAPKKGYTICPDCGAEYLIGKLHMMFCPAHTCDECGTSYSNTIGKGADGRRVCETCQNPEE